MPRGPRIEIPGLINHVMVRGIEKKEIFTDKAKGMSGVAFAHKLGMCKSGISKLNRMGGR